MRFRSVLSALLVLGSCTSSPPELPLDGIVSPILAEDRIPGAVIVVGSSDRVLYRKAFGTASLDTIYDLASCTKVVATTTAAMQLVEQGRLGLDDPVEKHLPYFEGRGMTVRKLLVHRSGFPAYFRPKARDSDGILREFLALKPVQGTVYS